MKLFKASMAIGLAMASALGLRAELRPRSVMVVNEGVTYRFQCYRDTVTHKFHGPVLVSRTDKCPDAALEPFSATSKTPAVILYPREENFENFFGRESAYHARPDEIVLYRYEDDKFTPLGHIDQGKTAEENENTLVSMLRVLISQCPDRNVKQLSASDLTELAAAFKADPGRWKSNRTGR